MILSKIFKDLLYGEFKQLDLGNYKAEELANELDPSDWEQVISYLNLGLDDLYKRFQLLMRELYIEQDESIAIYVLHSDYAQENTGSAIPLADRFIADSVDNLFEDDILKIEEVFDEEGNKLFLNDSSEALSVYTPSWRSIQLPYPNDFDTVAVQYRAMPPHVVYSAVMDITATEVECPDALKDCLLYFIGARAWSSINKESPESSTYWQDYLTAIELAKTEGFGLKAEPGAWRFDEMGWV